LGVQSNRKLFDLDDGALAIDAERIASPKGIRPASVRRGTPHFTGLIRFAIGPRLIMRSK
jgi:hypothetical protein